MEAFQNRTLRPILTLQNPLILTLVGGYLEKYCPRFARLSLDSRLAYVRDILTRDSRPKHVLVGLVAGHFTQEEFAFFCAHEAEVRRRLVDLCIERVQDQIDQLGHDDDA